jgi:hypothetical protein
MIFLDFLRGVDIFILADSEFGWTQTENSV